MTPNPDHNFTAPAEVAGHTGMGGGRANRMVDGPASNTCNLCDRPPHARGLCCAHYQQERRAGTWQNWPLRPRPYITSEPYVQRQDVDELAVTLVVDDGYRMRLNIAERARAVQLLTRRGLDSRQIAERLGVTDRTVFRWRSRAVI